MQNNKIGFNNFKSFGEQVQTFSKKPITLLYGPNSIGKSSCLHFLLYIEYVKQTGDIDLHSSDFAGDPINLGGFENFIHRKVQSNKFKYQLILNKPSEIYRYFSSAYTDIKKFERDGAFLNKEMDMKDLENRVNSYIKKDNRHIHIPKSDRIRLKYLLRFPKTLNHKELIFNELANFSVDNDDILPDSLQEHFKIFKSCLESNESLESVLIRKDNQSFDILDKLIIYIMDLKDLSIFNRAVNDDQRVYAIWLAYKLFYAIKNIHSIKLDFQFGLDNKDATYTLDYYIDNDVIYSYSSVSDSYDNYTSDIANIIKESESHSIKFRDTKSVQAFDIDFLNPTNTSVIYPAFQEQISIPTDMFIFGNPYSNFVRSLNNRVIYSLLQESKTRPSQYLGPIRFIPQRRDMMQQKSNIIHKNDTDNNYMDFVLETPWLVNNNIIPRKLRIMLHWKFWMFMLKQLKIDIQFSDSWNFFRKKINKVSSGDAMNSEQMWSNFVNSPDIQRKVNQWLSDDEKLKTPYNIYVKESNKHTCIRRLFRRNPLTYSRLTFIDKRTNTHVTPQEMGLGISQVLPILIAAFTLKDYKIFIEQPELHLHPAVQCEIADEIIKSFNTNNNEFVIESHSEHLLLRIMKRLRQTAEGNIDADNELALTPDDICLLYVDNNGKTTFLNELELDNDGTLLDPWPNGFFEEGYRERFD